MQTINKFNQMISTPDIGQSIKISGLQMASDLNCMRIGIIQEFYANDLTVKVQIANKKQKSLNADGTANVGDFTPVIAKVCYCNPYITNEIKQGDECLVLFADREIESWFMTGSSQPEGHTRMHALTDAVAILGIRSIPQMISILRDCLNLFYGNSNIQIKDDEINTNTTTYNLTSPTINVQGDSTITGNTTQTGEVSITGNITNVGTTTATSVVVTSAPTAILTSMEGRKFTVTNGIITAIV